MVYLRTLGLRTSPRDSEGQQGRSQIVLVLSFVAQQVDAALRTSV